jgi:hypothetical protein
MISSSSAKSVKQGIRLPDPAESSIFTAPVRSTQHRHRIARQECGFHGIHIHMECDRCSSIDPFLRSNGPVLYCICISATAGRPVSEDNRNASVSVSIFANGKGKRERVSCAKVREFHSKDMFEVPLWHCSVSHVLFLRAGKGDVLPLPFAGTRFNFSKRPFRSSVCSVPAVRCSPVFHPFCTQDICR